MTLPQPPRLDAVNQVRTHQRHWLETTRKQVLDGGHFAICNGDEFEEVFIAMGIPVVAINYWNYLVAAQQKTKYFFEVLNKRGYVGDNFFALGLASTMAPEQAPWGGLPKPTLICGSLRYEMELRVTELWAREFQCPIIPMDFAFPTPALQSFPADWFDRIRDEWETLVDPARLEFRVAQERRAITYVEQLSGKTFSVGELERAMNLINEQMDWWRRARLSLGAAKPCPVNMRDQMSMYQAMWHRGTEAGVKLVRDYCLEVEDRAARGVGGYANERLRFFYGDQVPAFQQWAEETYGAVAVACSYSGFPDAYARNVHHHDPMRALAGRHLLLALFEANFIVGQAKDHKCDAIIMLESHTVPEYPSAERKLSEANGIPYLAIPRDTDDPEIRALVAQFIEERLL